MGVSKNINSLSKTLGFKILLVSILGLLIMIPMGLIRSVIDDRQDYQKEAIDSIIKPIGGAFNLTGVVIALPYTYTVSTVREGKDGKDKITYETRKDYIIIMPDTYNVSGFVETSVLSRGIFKAPVFSSDMKITGVFRKYDDNISVDEENIIWDEAILILATYDRRNFKKLPDITVDDKIVEQDEYSVLPSTTLFSNGFAFKIDENKIKSGFDFIADISIQGGKAINIVPMGGDNKIEITSDWQDPSFSGGWLPTEREVGKDGFKASWAIASFNTSFSRSWLEKDAGYDSQYDVVKTSFLLLNDNYQKTYRSIKYSILFIFVPFFALFLCEILTRKKIHIVQYALIGLANAVFYMLLLSISEHTYFNLSYIISAIMVIILTSLYVGSITKTLKLGIAIAFVEFVIYLFLFGILQLTDYALLVGTIGLFLAIAVAMYFTRNIDWYNTENNNLDKE